METVNNYIMILHGLPFAKGQAVAAGTGRRKPVLFQYRGKHGKICHNR